MNCRQCGDTMCPETVITVAPGMFGLRRRSFEAAYCLSCKRDVVLAELRPASTRRMWLAKANKRLWPATRKSVGPSKWRKGTLQPQPPAEHLVASQSPLSAV